ncbi:MAG: Fe-S protein [Hadesarchaea archaeon]|nr:MAG: Fe-S protein [Hadesarchaea archaeon]
MIEEIIVLGILGLIFGAGLEIASRKFAVGVDEKIKKVRELLPGLNCGACGFGGCEDYASALVKDPSLIDRCRIVSSENRNKIKELLEI